MANVIGKDKLTMEGRVKYTESVTDMIHKCAKNPWQSIATMFELSNALNVRIC
jgi:DNA-directed RNA polymerase